MSIPARKQALWDRAIQRYHDELHDARDLENSIWHTTSIEELHVQAKATVDASVRASLLGSLSRLRPGLAYLNDFMSALAVVVGVDAKITALIWGSIRLMLIAQPLMDMLEAVTQVLEDLVYTLPKLALYVVQLPPSTRLDDCLVEVYAEVIWFCAHTISFFRIHRSLPNPIKKGWPKLVSDLQSSMKRIKRHAEQVELEIEALRSTFNPERQQQLNGLLEQLSVQGNFEQTKVPRCFHVPMALKERYVQRQDIVNTVAAALSQASDERRSKCFALYGTGGVGKTQIALQYAYHAFQKQGFDAVFWVSADTYVRMTQDYLAIAEHLGLSVGTTEATNPSEAMTKVKAWLRDQRCSWLLIFDNADDLDVLDKGWPGGHLGSILITTRDASARSHPASEGFQVKPFGEKDGGDAFIHMLGSGYEGDHNAALGEKIAKAVGGLPLALNQISSYIRDQKMRLEEFTPLYEKRQRKVHEKKPRGYDSTLTIATVWTMALKKLSGNSATLQRLLAFFDADGVSEILLQRGADKLVTATSFNELEFLTDDFDFNESKTALFRASLVDRNPDTKALSTHRLLQSAIVHELSVEEQQYYLRLSSRVLKEVFPSSWSDGADGYVFKEWQWCSICLPHALYMAKEFSHIDMNHEDMKELIELFSRSAWFLYETEGYSDCQYIVKTNLKLIQRCQMGESLGYAQSVNLLGLIEVDLGLPAQAVDHFKEALLIRQKLCSPDDWGIAVSLSNVGLAYSELGDFENAMKYHGEALQFRTRINCHLLANSVANIAAALLRNNKLQEAEDMYRKVKGMETFKDDDVQHFLQEELPRYSGGLVLISMVREAQGNIQAALDMMFKVLEYRKKKFGSRFKTCDSLCRIASLLQRMGRPTSGLIFLEECITTAVGLPMGEGYLALAHYRAYQIHAHEGQDVQAQESLRNAVEARRVVISRSTNHIAAQYADDDERGYVSLVTWLLW